MKHKDFFLQGTTSAYAENTAGDVYRNAGG